MKRLKIPNGNQTVIRSRTENTMAKSTNNDLENTLKKQKIRTLFLQNF